MSENLRGSLFMILAMAAFSIEDMLFKMLSQVIPAGQALTLFGALGAVSFAILTRANGEAVFSRGLLSRVMVLRSACELTGRLFYALALALTPLSSASAILQATPLFVALGAVLFLKQSVGWRQWTAIFIGFIGVLLILRPGMAGFQANSIFALIGTLGFAGRDLATRASAPSLSNNQLGFVGFSILCIAGLVLWSQTPNIAALALPQVALLIGVVTIGLLAYSSLTIAMRAGDVSVIAPFRYSRLIFGLALGIAFFGERPDQLTILGGIIIVFAGLFVLLRRQ